MQGDTLNMGGVGAFGGGAFGTAASFGSGGATGPYGGPSRLGGVAAGASAASTAASAPAPAWGGGGLPGDADGGLEDFANEPPLLEELGISFSHIRTKLTAVMLLHRAVPLDIMQDSDMAGPLVFCLALGFFLLLTGKLFLGYIYGFGMMGCIALFTLLTLMADKDVALDLSRTFSALGYALLPIVALAAVNVLVSLKGALGALLGLLAVLWSTTAATRIFEASMAMAEQRWLIAYPVFLFYFSFALITIF